MRAFLAIKYYDNVQNKELIENITNMLKRIDIDTFVFVRDIENYGSWTLSSEDLMERSFKEIDKSDILLIEASEPSIGIGIEAGYAYTKNIPVYLIANKNAVVSSSIKGISKKCIFYEKQEDIMQLKDYIKE